ncbi:MAG TPA: ABC transporter ATP-binding protein [Candidatus Eisenbacteria bacterium]|nr:ABC transporter ATP-binding protein [Candidatus Eisenbacteria bacterium]
MLRLELASRRDAFTLEVALEVRDDAPLVLVGESGAGKTTLLELLAGLLRAERGRIELDGETWFDAAAGVFVPPERRGVGYVAQDHALFPHLTVADNVAFGLRARGVPARETAARVTGALERTGAAVLARRRPHELSGGQQQRVAIARALAIAPRLLLLDEPLSALDPAARRALRPELRRLLAGAACPAVYVTHHPTEALALGGEVAVLEGGRITQRGPREELMRHPRSRYVAEFLGVNFLRGASAGGDPAAPRIVGPHGAFALVEAGEADCTAVVDPRDITLTRERPDGSARNVFEGAVEELAPEPPDGALVRVSLATRPPLIAEVTREAVAALALAHGARVYASFKAAGVVVMP